MTVLVLGASSQIGCFLLPRLVATGEPVVALSRRPQPALGGVEWKIGRLPDQVPALPTLSAVVSCGPLPECVAWLERAPLPDAPRVVAVSSMSVVAKQAAEDPVERELVRRLAAAETGLAAACERQGSAWTLLRPTLLYGAGRDRSLTPIARRAERLRVFPLPGGRGLRQPLHVDDLAHALLAALETPDAARRILPMGGGERLCVRAMFARVRKSLPRATLPLPLPAWLLHAAGRVQPRWRGPLSRLDQDLVADNAEVYRLFGIAPRRFEPTYDMWRPAA